MRTGSDTTTSCIIIGPRNPYRGCSTLQIKDKCFVTISSEAEHRVHLKTMALDAIYCRLVAETFHQMHMMLKHTARVAAFNANFFIGLCSCLSIGLCYTTHIHILYIIYSCIYIYIHTSALREYISSIYIYIYIYI